MALEIFFLSGNFVGESVSYEQSLKVSQRIVTTKCLNLMRMTTIGFQPLLQTSALNLFSVAFGGQSTLSSQVINAKFFCLTLLRLTAVTMARFSYNSVVLLFLMRHKFQGKLCCIP